MRKLTVLICVFFLTGSALAAELRFEASVDKPRISLGEALVLNLTFYNVENIAAPQLPELDEFKTNYLGPSTIVSIVNNKAESSITHKYSLVPLKEGTFTIGSLAFVYKGKTYNSKPIKIDVVPPQAPGLAASGNEEIDLSDRIFLIIAPARNKVYLNEIIPFAVKLYVNELAVGDEELPEVSQEGFLINWQEKVWHRDVLDGVAYRVLEYRGNLTAIAAGEFLLGPAKLNCNLVIRRKQTRGQSSFFGGNFFDNFFSRFDKHPLTIESKAVPMEVLLLPENNKPEDFNGAIGNFSFGLTASPQKVKVGDPITLKMIISGEGNFDALTIPLSGLEDKFKVYDAQVRLQDNSKVFEQILMPKNDNISEIPEVVFSFFNPRSNEYETIRRGPIPIDVSPSEDSGALRILEYSGFSPDSSLSENLGKGIIYIKETIGPLRKKGIRLYKNRIFLIGQALLLFLLIIFLIGHARSDRIKRDSGYARSLRAPRKARLGLKKIEQALKEENRREFYDNAFLTLREYLGDRFRLPAAGITIDVVDEVLKERNIDLDILRQIKEVFNDCDMARYAPSTISLEAMKGSFKKIGKIIEYLQKRRV